MKIEHPNGLSTNIDNGKESGVKSHLPQFANQINNAYFALVSSP